MSEKKKNGPPPRQPIKFEKPVGVKPNIGRPKQDVRLQRVQRPLTRERLELFLQVLTETGSMTAAAREATPWSKTESGGLATFHKEMKCNPEFKEAVEEAKDIFVGAMNEEIVRRAFEPTERPIVSQGEVIATELKYDNNLLMRVAQRHQPDKWNPKHELKHSGQVNHGVMVVGAIEQSTEDWEEKYGGDQPELEAGDEDAIDVD